jgi:hypothetical protein
MPIQKLILTCDKDGSELECAGGYLNNDQDATIIIYFCPQCKSYYLAFNGEFIEGSWAILEAIEAEEIQSQIVSKTFSKEE